MVQIFYIRAIALSLKRSNSFLGQNGLFTIVWPSTEVDGNHFSRIDEDAANSSSTAIEL